MKKYIIILLLVIVLPAQQAAAQLIIIDIIKGVTKKVIRQIDLRVQQLQNKTIALQNAQKALENSFSKSKLGEINDWLEKQRKLYDDYYRELSQVKATIAAYRDVKDIAAKQLELVAAYRRAFTMFQGDKNFSPEELRYMSRVYEGMLAESSKNLDNLLLVTTAGKIQMSDAARLKIIKEAAKNMEQHLGDLRQFNNQNLNLSIQRAKERNEIKKMQQLYELKN